MTPIVTSYLSPHDSAKELLDKLAAGSAPYTREYEVLAEKGQSFWSLRGKGFAIASLVCGIFWAVSRAITLSPFALSMGYYYGIAYSLYTIVAYRQSKIHESKVCAVEDIYRKMQCYIDAKYFEKARFLEERNIVDKSQDKAIEKLIKISKAFDEGKVNLPQPVIEEHLKLRVQVEAILKREAPVKPVSSQKWYNGCFISCNSWERVEAQWAKFRNCCHRYYHGFPLNHEGMRTYLQVFQDPTAELPQFLAGRWE